MNVAARPYATQPPPAELELVVGNRGMGKSHLARELTRTHRRLVVWDPMGDEPQLGHGTVTVSTLEAALDKLRAGPVRVAIRPTRWGDKELVAEFERACELVYRLGGVHFKVEETGLVASAGVVPGAFKRLLILGRHRRVSLTLTAQRFAMVPVLARDNASRIYVFRQAGPDDAADLVDRIGELGREVRELPPRHFIAWTPSEGAARRHPVGN